MKTTVQTALRLPRAVHESIKLAGGERGLGDEIRRRLAEWEILQKAGYRVVWTVAVPMVEKPK